MENTANDPRCADDIAGEIWMQYPLRLWALAERNARSDSSSIILTIFKQIFTDMHTPTSQFCHRREDVVSRMRLGSGHVTSPSNKVSWNAARHRLEVDRAKLPSRQILTYSLRDERHSGLGWGRGGGGRQQIFTAVDDTSHSAEPGQSGMLLYYPRPGPRLLSRIV